MKKFLKLLLALFMALSLAACSSDDDDEEDDVIIVDEDDEEDDESDELEGSVTNYTILYDNEERDITVQVENETSIIFFFADDLQSSYAVISLWSGEMDIDTVADTFDFFDTDSNGYDDFTFCYTDGYGNYIQAEYDYNTDNSDYESVQFDTLEGEPSEQYQDVWYLNADLNQDSFGVDQWGNWAIITADGLLYQTGYAYEDDDACNLYDMTGDLIGNITLEDDTWLVVTIDGGTEYYARQENSTNGQ